MVLMVSRQAEAHGGTTALQVKMVTLKQEGKGKVKEDTDDLTPICLLTSEQFERIRALSERIPADWASGDTDEEHGGIEAEGPTAT